MRGMKFVFSLGVTLTSWKIAKRMTLVSTNNVIYLFYNVIELTLLLLNLLIILFAIVNLLANAKNQNFKNKPKTSYITHKDQQDTKTFLQKNIYN